MKSNFPGIRPSIARWVTEDVFCSGAARKDVRGQASPGTPGAEFGGSVNTTIHSGSQPESSPATTTKLMLIAAVVMVVCTLAYSMTGPA